MKEKIKAEADSLHRIARNIENIGKGAEAVYLKELGNYLCELSRHISLSVERLKKMTE